MSTRKIKVQARHERGRLFQQPGTTFGKLTLAGQWMNAAGFPPGTPTEIEVREGELVIRATTEQPKRPAVVAPWSESEVGERVTFYNH